MSNPVRASLAKNDSTLVRLGRWDVLSPSTNLRRRASIAAFFLPLSEWSERPEPVIRGRAPRGSKHFPAVAQLVPKCPGTLRRAPPAPSASFGFCFSGMAASILEVGNVIVSILLFFF